MQQRKYYVKFLGQFGSHTDVWHTYNTSPWWSFGSGKFRHCIFTVWLVAIEKVKADLRKFSGAVKLFPHCFFCANWNYAPAAGRVGKRYNPKCWTANISVLWWFFLLMYLTFSNRPAPICVADFKVCVQFYTMHQEKNKKEAEQEDREKMQFLVSNFTGEHSTESSLNYKSRLPLIRF